MPGSGITIELSKAQIGQVVREATEDDDLLSLQRGGERLEMWPRGLTCGPARRTAMYRRSWRSGCWSAMRCRGSTGSR